MKGNGQDKEKKIRSAVCLYLMEEGGAVMTLPDITIGTQKFSVGGSDEEGVIVVDYSEIYRMCSDVVSMIDATRASEVIMQKMGDARRRSQGMKVVGCPDCKRPLVDNKCLQCGYEKLPIT